MATAEILMGVSLDDELLKKYANVHVAIESIGPFHASAYLESNTKNRRLNDAHVRRLTDIMLAGDWWMNGETIIFGADGTLLNGQHRLHAIIKSGATVDCLVVRGIDEHAFRTLDGGRTRTTGEVLSMDGEKNANCVASAVQALLSFVDSGGLVTGTTCNARKATPSLTSRVLFSYPQIRESVVAMKRNSLFRNQYGYMLHFVFSLVSDDIAEDFASVLADGHTDVGRPFMVFREHLISTPNRPDLRRSYCAKAIKAFNAELSNERPKMFKFLASEDFPTIAGLDYQKLAESIG
jgi:hypothetical protein